MVGTQPELMTAVPRVQTQLTQPIGERSDEAEGGEIVVPLPTGLICWQKRFDFRPLFVVFELGPESRLTNSLKFLVVN